jgi:hypothetical protein
MENQYPIDYEALKKGDMLDIYELEKIFAMNHQPGSKAWDFAVMGLQQKIHHQTGLTVKCDNGALRILSDAEASEANAAEVDRHKRGIFSRNRKLLQVDRGALTNDQAAVHDRRLLICGTYAAALIGAKRTIIAQSPTDAIPPRLGPAVVEGGE